MTRVALPVEKPRGSRWPAGAAGGFGGAFTTGLGAGGRGATDVLAAGAAGLAATTGAELVLAGVEVADRVADGVGEVDDALDPAAVAALVASGTTAALLDAELDPAADRMSGGVLVGPDGVVLSATGRLARLSSIATPNTATAAAAMATRTAVVDTTRNADMLRV
jgi:hypothetical protein